MLESFHFLRPAWLLALIPALGLVWLIHRRQDARREWAGIVDDHLRDHLLAGENEQRRLRPVHLLAAVWIMAMTALSGPTWQREPAPFAEDEAALVIVVEVTPTMMAQDVQPSRLERAAQKIRDLLELRPNAKTALIAYSGSAHLVMPLTRDTRIVQTFTDELSPKIMPKDGDSASAAIALADDVLQRSGRSGSILLISDGVSDENRAALKDRDSRFSLHILAVGAVGKVELPPGSPPAPALDVASIEELSKAIEGTWTVISPDDRDVRRLSRQIDRSFAASQREEGGERWHDAGFWLVPIIALLSLTWFRPGWVVRQESS